MSKTKAIDCERSLSLLCRVDSMIDRRPLWRRIKLEMYSPATLRDELKAIDEYRKLVVDMLAQRETAIADMQAQLRAEHEIDY